VAVASTGIAATLLINGRTAHSTFDIPFDLNKNSTSSMSYRSKKVKKILDADLIIFDEAPKASKYLFNCIDKLLRNLLPENKNIPFGGKHFVLGGDFRQVIPVVTKSSRCKIVESSLKCSCGY
jgi:ATP-dependent DNA helicase PIF1